MYITPKNKARLNAMIYRDGMQDKEIANALGFTVAFVKRYRASVERRLEKGEITRQSILNGVAHFRVPHIMKSKAKDDGKPKAEVEAPRPDPMVGTPSFEKLKDLFEELATPAMKRLIEALDKGTLTMQSLSMSWDNTYTITLKEVQD